MSKNIYAIVIFSSLIAINDAVSQVTLCKDISSKSMQLQLKTHLFCDYDVGVRPVDNTKNLTKVWLTFMPKLFELNDKTNNFALHCWTIMNWSDPHLSWNPDDFDGIQSLQIPSTDIWIPDITVHNSGDASDDQTGIPTTTCGLNSNGDVLCVPPIMYKSHCDTDYTNYPYDTQTCQIQLGSWSYSMDEINLMYGQGFVLTDLKPNQEWKVTEVGLSVNMQDYKMNTTLESYLLIFEFKLQRRSAGMHTVCIAPAIALMVLTLSVLWLDCLSTERIIIACINFIGHLICSMNVFFSIPYNGGVTPKILRFYELSFIIMAFSLILTVLLREVQTLTKQAPQWLTSTTSLVLQSKVGQILLLSILDPKASAFLEMSADDNADLVQAERTSNTWNYVALLIGWLAFISVLFTYLIMLTLFLPTNAYLSIE